ncbi:hypothetical protein ACFYNY_13150 [Streptomyces sp. NPDC006530]|uniref:hypothetical protein n=1 Tax=Streptomyces sp. NPDC006530 TaxID=3364750 RepID=UPI0036B11139
MSGRHTLRPRNGVVATAMVMALAFAAAGCGDGGKDGSANAGSSQPASSGKGHHTDTAAASPDSTATLAQATGEGGVVLTVNNVKRDSGGFLTIAGLVKNTGADDFVATSPWAGTERDVLASGDSVAGATLVDKVGKKRYYVLRDTGGKCLCTMGISSIKAGQTVPFFAQFPAPPATTKEVDFQLPTFPTMTVPVSG